VPRVFADASVLVAGAGSRTGASRAVLVMAEIGLYWLKEWAENRDTR
jgi:hypothetical protein